MDIASKKISGNYKYLTYLTSIYSFFFILPSLLLKKIIILPFIGNIPISILFTGIYFILLDVITEVYGYKEAKKTLLAGLINYTLFVFIMELISRIPSPIDIPKAETNVYYYLFNNLHLVWISILICGLTANTLNMFILSKWKTLLQGKYFWMRSIATSFFAMTIYTMVTNYFAFCFNHMQYAYYSKLVLVSLLAKLVTLIILSYPGVALCAFLKHKEAIDIYDHPSQFNLSFS